MIKIDLLAPKSADLMRAMQKGLALEVIISCEFSAVCVCFSLDVLLFYAGKSILGNLLLLWETQQCQTKPVAALGKPKNNRPAR